jgi:succinate dehydrogenase subunit D
MRKSKEPLFWSLFSAGGMLTALLTPAMIIVTGFLLAANDVGFARLHDVVSSPIGKVALFGLASLTFFHWAHRFRHVLVDIGLRRFSLALAGVCYLAALGGTVWAGIVVFA